MSGVLDRMAKRALGALSTIQPLTPPQYAPVAGGIRPSLLELNTSFPPVARSGGIERVPEAHPRILAEAGRPEINESRPRVSQPPIPKAVPPTGLDTAPAATAAGKIDRIGGSVDLGPDQPRETEPPPAGASVIQAAEFPAESLMDLAGKEAATPPAMPRTPQLEGETPDSRNRKDSSLEVATAPARPGRARRATQSPDANRESEQPSEPRTEIHISIGSIELRAPRVEARPAVAPFRPRVSLQDFCAVSRRRGHKRCLAVGGVTTVLKALLNTGLSEGGPSTVLVSPPGITNKAPDLIPTGQDEPPQLNLFMYYASINPALRNLDLPSMNSSGGQLSNPPLAINLHYLVTAYGGQPVRSGDSAGVRHAGVSRDASGAP